MIRDAVQRSSFPHCCIPCYGHSSSQQLIRVIWFEFRAAVKKTHDRLFGSGSSLRLGGDTERPTKFAQMCGMMRRLMDAAFDHSLAKEEGDGEAVSSNRSVCFHLVLERLDAMRGLDDEDQPQHSLMVRLLQISKVSPASPHPVYKFINTIFLSTHTHASRLWPPVAPHCRASSCLER
jgi:hypothetical protein